MEVLEDDIPPQPAGERRRMALIWLVLGIASAIVVLLDTPYRLDRQSTILVKSEAVVNIKSAREREGAKWPVNERDNRYGHGARALAENPPPSFRFLSLGHDDHDPEIEIAVYEFKMRNEIDRIKIRYNPNEIPKKSLISF